MKILSRENHKQGSKHVLIPCYLYEIVTSKCYGGNNILEEAVRKIITIDSSYKNSTEKLAEILGLKNNNDDIDYRALLKLVLNKIDNPKTQALREEVVQYQIYQERISGEVLGIITRDVDRFIESSGGNKNKNEILFERGGRNFKARVIYPPKPSGISIPTLDQVFKAVAIHNKNNDFKVSENLDLEVPKHKEGIYLHCQIVLDENLKFNITNGFNSAFSLQLGDILSNHCRDLLKSLRADNYIDEKQENNYKRNYGDLRDEIAYNLQRFAKENKCQYLYNAYEQYFAYLVQKNDYTIPCYLNDPKFIKDYAEQMGFTIKQTKLFINDNGDNLKSYLAKLLFRKDATFSNFAKESEFLNLLSMLHNDRNIALHGESIENNNKPMDIKELNILKKLLESISNIYTKKDKETRSDNGIILLEQELPEKIVNRLSDDNIEALAKTYKALEVCEDSKELSLDAFGDITQGLYKVCESVMRQYIQIHKNSIKEEYIEKTRMTEWLSKVGEHHIKKAKQGENATLGAYTVIYLSINQDENLLYIKQLLELRAHANPTVEDIKKTSIDEVKKLHKSIIDFITKIIYHI
ncbi:hypothetical protein [Helicobacter pullorum]|uniref:hypothetical protein n=1 Tax=Helicobacter pullorum TaxID=35818 RepID=UPI000816AAC0|nr:hypothetical protein [Helicobacter pullorum]OCR13742.1 hypothetical protein BA916_07990 [Helicobacter pullorum]